MENDYIIYSLRIKACKRKKEGESLNGISLYLDLRNRFFGLSWISLSLMLNTHDTNRKLYEYDFFFFFCNLKFWNS